MISASNRTRASLVWAALAVGCGTFAASGCGARGHAAPVTGRHSYDVVAHLTMAPRTSSFPVDLPGTLSLSLTLDADAGLLVMGAAGGAQVIPTARDGDTFSATTMPVHLPVVSQSCGQGLEGLDFSSFEVSVTEATLMGSAKGLAEIADGDVLSDIEFTATLSGGPDLTPPSLIATGAVTSPFDAFALSVSEPLPESATAHLVASDGSQFDLVPAFVYGALKVISAFEKPAVVLHPGNGYAVAMGGLVDFAGNAAVDDAPLRVVTIPAAPLIADDGFESATGSPMIGGASLVTAGGPVPPIAGAASVYIGQPGAPALGAVAPGTGLLVRVPRKATDTKLRFSYCVVWLSSGSPSGNGLNVHVYVGSVDGPAAAGVIPREPSPQGMGASASVEVTGVAVMEVPLADASASDLVVSIPGQVAPGCGLVGSPGGLGLLIDDLRAE
jgi:hypothetical protein